MSVTTGQTGFDAIATPTTTVSDPLTALIAMAEPLRWRIINLLAPGRVLTGIEIAAELGRNTDGVNKQLRILRDAGLVSSSPGVDRRYARYQILPTVRMTPGVLDYGFCTLRLSHARPNDVAKD